MTSAKRNAAVSIAGMALALSFGLVSAAGALTTSCAGIPSASNIVWTASTSGGVTPIAFLWGNGSTSSVQTVAVAPGTYAMTIQATDASSTVATSTCSASVAASTTTSTNAVAAQIQALLNQIAALRNQIVQLVQQNSGATPPTISTSTPPTIGCFKFNKDLHFGDRGSDVRDLQTLILPPGLATGFFGKKTEDALKKLHIRLGTGSSTSAAFGPNIRRIFRRHCNDKDIKWLSSTTTFSVSGKHDDEDNDRGENHGNKGKGRGKGNPHDD